MQTQSSTAPARRTSNLGASSASTLDEPAPGQPQDRLERHDIGRPPPRPASLLPDLLQPKRAAKQHQRAIIRNAVESINRQVFVGTKTWSTLYPTDGILSWPGELWLKRDASQRVLGYALTTGDRPHTVLQFLAVDVEHRRKGVARDILLGLAGLRAPLNLRVRASNTAAQKLYESLCTAGYALNRSPDGWYFRRRRSSESAYL